MSRLLDEALALDEAERHGWLAALGAENQDIAQALREALSLGSSATEEELSTLPKVGADDEGGSYAESSLKPGTRVGPYELIRALGTGGMAEVWLARRADGAFKREVAVKLPMMNRLRKDLERRFARERDILASLEHPNIARLYDAGADPQGLPYIAMEYVPGQPLASWCDEHRLAIPERLTLFLHVLEAVQYAHEKQVIHRDLKPSNILVTEAGQVRLLDFGVAKLLVDETNEAPLTSVYGRALTPDYASPELLKGDPIDVRGDVYSLGVVLYELLSGTRPYRLERAASLGMLGQAMATIEVKKPSTQIEPEAATSRSMNAGSLARRLRGDLDAITLKALAKDPRVRYESARAMREDLERYLGNRPIKARRGVASYRLKKFAVRHRWIIAVSALASVLVVAVAYELEHPLATLPAVSAAAFHPPPGTIAVLPFTNLSGDPNQEYFSDGLSEELINALSHIDALQVTARTSSFSFKGQNVDIATIARKLGVAAVLEGSIRRDGNTVRATVQLINGVNGFHIWSEDYDRDLKNLLALQTDIATTVAQQLKARLVGNEPRRIADGGTSTPAALDAYLHGSRLLRDSNDDKTDREALAYLEQAVTLDPTFAAAHARKADALADIAGDVDKPAASDRLLAAASNSAQRAIDLAPELADGYLAMAGILRGQWKFQEAASILERALLLNPGSERIQANAANLESLLGHHELALKAAHRAVELDPLNYGAMFALANSLWLAKRFDEALIANRAALQINPKSFANVFEGIIRYSMKQPAAARQICESGRPIPPDQRHACLSLVYRATADPTKALRELQEFQQHAQGAGAYAYAEIYSQWGDARNALDWLRKAEASHLPDLQSLKVDPMLDPIRGQQEFTDLERRLNFPP